MQLRRWQYEAVACALQKYRSGQSHFLCLATPGAGKTIMASTVAKKLLHTDDIDFVFCFSPSINVANSFKATLETVLGCRLDGLLGAKGRILTYQSMLSLEKLFWSLLASHRALVIFDEIHHCADNNPGNTNTWGQKIIEHIQGQATYTLALTGTPWRSDKIPIALSSYCHRGKVQCDYQYGLDQAIKDGVCRIPQITAVDNENIKVNNGSNIKNYSSFSDFLKSSKCTYQQLLENTTLITYLVNICNAKLRAIRTKNPDAGGLIVAASVEHAFRISGILYNKTGEKAVVVTYMDNNALEIIQQYRHSDTKWIISVGMISEGTDIPRLKVCCHLTRVKTELYFRQVLGRILRAQQQEKKDEAFLYMPAEPSLIEYAQRVAEDVPESNAISIDTMGVSPDSEATTSITVTPVNQELENFEIEIGCENEAPEHSGLLSQETGAYPETDLSDGYETSLGLFGKFKQRMISLSLISA